MPPSRGDTYKSKAQIAEETERAVNLRRVGATYREIAEILGVRISDVHYRVSKRAPELIRGRAYCAVCERWVKSGVLHQSTHRSNGGSS